MQLIDLHLLMKISQNFMQQLVQVGNLFILIYSLRPVKSVHIDILGQIMKWSKKCIGKMQATISLLFNYPTPNELSACRN